MKVVPAGARKTNKGPSPQFTGTVLTDEVVDAIAPSHLRATVVSFTPGARTSWHAHPVGQTLYVLSGVGRVQVEGEAPVILQPGDTAVIPPNKRHWHGAASDRLFVHLAMSETDAQGNGTQWFEPVTDGDYTAPAVEPK